MEIPAIAVCLCANSALAVQFQFTAGGFNSGGGFSTSPSFTLSTSALGGPIIATIVKISCSTTEQGAPSTFYADKDGDGYGNPSDFTTACVSPPGYVPDSSDCNDTNPNVNPGATEYADGEDNNCDGSIDENLNSSDDDGDGYSEASGDCRDDDNTTYPGATELPDGRDNDCDGVTDEDTSLSDDDGDGYTEMQNDCDDENPFIHPEAVEYADGVDNDCDGLVDEDLDEADNDGDGYSVADGDCNDSDLSINPGALEIAGNGLDDDCDGAVDEDAGASGLEIDPDALYFGEVALGTSKDGAFTVRNTDNTDIELNAVTFDDPSGPFVLVAALPMRLRPGQELPLQFRFTPQDIAFYSATATLYSTSQVESATVLRFEGHGVLDVSNTPTTTPPPDDTSDVSPSPSADDATGCTCQVRRSAQAPLTALLLLLICIWRMMWWQRD